MTRFKEYYKRMLTSRTGRFGLNTYSIIIFHVVNIVISLLIIPFILNKLGVILYGVWIMIQQLIGFMVIGDMNPLQTLKFTLAKEQHSKDDDLKRRQVGASISIWIRFTPLIIIPGLLIILFCGKFLKVDLQYIPAIKVAIAISILTLLFSSLFNLPGAVLRGMNLEFFSTLTNSTILIFSAFANVLVLWIGWGIIGLSSVNFITLIITGSILYLIARKKIGWFSVKKPTKNDISYMWKYAKWNFISSLFIRLLGSTDKLIIGLLLSPASVTIYALTQMVISRSRNFLELIISNSSPGIGDLYGRKDTGSLKKVWRSLRIMGLTFSVGVASIIFCFNKF